MHYPHALNYPRSSIHGVSWMHLTLLMGLVLGISTTIPRQLPAQNLDGDVFAQRDNLPPWFIKPFGIVEHKDHPGFAQYSAALGDVNGDGYGDLAISSSADTTFLFFGGDTLDPNEDGFVFGGSAGIAALDLNGDGRRDLVTTIEFRNTPEETGIVRIHFQLDRAPYFSQTPDLLITGLPGSRLGATAPNRNGLQGLDFNGDGYMDLTLINATKLDSSVGTIRLYLGGPSMDTIVDREFRPRRSGRNSAFGTDRLTGDFNGDGYDDLMIGGRVYDWERSELNLYYDLFLGNVDADVSQAHRFFDWLNGWSPDHGFSGAMDVNADGYADIIDKWTHRIPGDALVFLGRDRLPDPILPTDSIPNRDPGMFGDIAPSGIYPVGDMNGDGTRDLIIAWAVYLVDGPLYLMYPSGPSSFRKPMGYRGIIPSDWFVSIGAFDAGDMNGDGCDDMVLLGKAAGFSEGKANRFVVFLGAKQMQTSIDETNAVLPGSIGIEVYPNPATAPLSQLSVRLSDLDAAEMITLSLHDALGRRLVNHTVDASSSRMNINLPVPSPAAGMYHIRVLQGQRQSIQSFTLF